MKLKPDGEGGRRGDTALLTSISYVREPISSHLFPPLRLPDILFARSMFMTPCSLGVHFCCSPCVSPISCPFDFRLVMSRQSRRLFIKPGRWFPLIYQRFDGSRMIVKWSLRWLPFFEVYGEGQVLPGQMGFVRIQTCPGEREILFDKRMMIINDNNMIRYEPTRLPYLLAHLPYATDPGVQHATLW